MWMAYAEANESKATDLNSAVTNLKSTFERLIFDADHEAIYGMNRFYSTAECQNIADNYTRASDLCGKYLNGVIGIEDLIIRLQQIGLTRFAFYLEEFLPLHLQQYLNVITNVAPDEIDGNEGKEEDCRI